MTTIWARHAHLPDGMASKVRITIAGDRIRAIEKAELPALSLRQEIDDDVDAEPRQGRHFLGKLVAPLWRRHRRNPTGSLTRNGEQARGQHGSIPAQVGGSWRTSAAQAKPARSTSSSTTVYSAWSKAR